MPIYEFICKTAQGKEVRGECKAKNPDDLEHTLRETGLMLKWCQEKEAGISKTVATRAFAKEVAGILHQMGEPRWYNHKSTTKEKLQSFFLFLFLSGCGFALYRYLDTRIALLEKLNFQPNIMRQVRQHATEDVAAPE